MKTKQERLIDEIFKVADFLDRKPKPIEMSIYSDQSCIKYIYHFGSWNDALEGAGFEPGKQFNLTRKELIDEINRLYEKLGRPPSINEDIPTHSKYTRTPFYNKFGTWDDTLKGADNTSPSKEDLINEIQRIANDFDTTPTSQLIQENSKYSLHEFIYEFNNFNNALIAAGYSPNEQSNQNKSISDSDLLSEIIRLFNELDHIPTRRDMNEHGEYSHMTYYHRFGSWGDALEAAQLADNRR